MTLARTTIATELAALVRVVPTPTGPLGYGSDLACASDLDPSMLELSGSDVRVVREALYRRLITPRGSMPGDPDYGLDVFAYCSRASGAGELRSLAGQIQNECTKDDRVSAARVVVSPDPTGNSLEISISCTPADPALAPFSLVVAAGEGGVSLVEELGQ